MLTFVCPNCERPHKAPPEAAGSPARCPCGRVFQIPYPDGHPPEPGVQPRAAGFDARAAATGRRTHRSTVLEDIDRVPVLGWCVRLFVLLVAVVLLSGCAVLVETRPRHETPGWAALFLAACYLPTLAAILRRHQAVWIGAGNSVVLGLSMFLSLIGMAVLGTFLLFGWGWLLREALWGGNRPPRPRHSAV